MIEMNTSEALCWKTYIAGVVYAVVVASLVLWSERSHAPLQPKWTFNIVFENQVVYTYGEWFYTDTSCKFFGRHFEDGLKDDRFSFVCMEREDV